MDNVYKIWEILIPDPLDDIEVEGAHWAAEENDFDVVINGDGRIMTIHGPTTIQELSKIIAIMHLTEFVGLIKEITTYEPVWKEPVIEINFEDFKNE